MPQYYKIDQGDYLAKLAPRFGFTDYHAIWDHPKNGPLKQKRVSPNVLFPGDILFIPDKAEKQVSRGTTKAHEFTVAPKTVLLRIVLKDADDQLVKPADYILNFPGKTIAKSTSSGLIEEEISISQSHVGVLIVEQPEKAFDVQVGIKIGHLNPVDTPSGQMARLNNLGYRAGKIEDGEKMDRKEPLEPKLQIRFQSAVEEFQCDYMGPAAVDGKCGHQTQAKLKQVYGC